MQRHFEGEENACADGGGFGGFTEAQRLFFEIDGEARPCGFVAVEMGGPLEFVRLGGMGVEDSEDFGLDFVVDILGDAADGEHDADEADLRVGWELAERDALWGEGRGRDVVRAEGGGDVQNGVRLLRVNGLLGGIGVFGSRELRDVARDFFDIDFGLLLARLVAHRGLFARG